MAGPIVGQQVDLTLTLLVLQPEFSSSMAEGATAAKEDEDSPEQPEPCKGVRRDVLRWLPCGRVLEGWNSEVPRRVGGRTQEEPPWRLTPELIIVGAAASLPAAVTTLTEVGLVVHSWAQHSKLGARRHLESRETPAQGTVHPHPLHTHTRSYPVNQV